MKLMRSLAAAGLLLAAASCGGSKYVPVSGVVTLNGAPYKNAVVSFQPLATGGNANPGRGSSAITDESGRFTLRTDTGETGAVVGKHKVRIQTNWDALAGTFKPETGSADNIPTPRSKKADPIPPEWYADTGGKEFEVPAGGTDKANFDIVTKKK